MEPSRTELRIPVTSIGPALARAAVPTVVPPMPAAAVADLQLLVSELIGGAVARSGARSSQDIRVVVTCEAGSIRVELSTPHGLPPLAPGGWGSLLLERLASSWAVDDTAGTPDIWFEIPTA